MAISVVCTIRQKRYAPVSCLKWIGTGLTLFLDVAHGSGVSISAGEKAEFGDDERRGKRVLKFGALGPVNASHIASMHTL